MKSGEIWDIQNLNSAIKVCYYIVSLWISWLIDIYIYMYIQVLHASDKCPPEYHHPVYQTLSNKLRSKWIEMVQFGSRSPISRNIQGTHFFARIPHQWCCSINGFVAGFRVQVCCEFAPLLQLILRCCRVGMVWLIGVWLIRVINIAPIKHRLHEVAWDKKGLSRGKCMKIKSHSLATEHSTAR